MTIYLKYKNLANKGYCPNCGYNRLPNIRCKNCGYIETPIPKEKPVAMAHDKSVE